MGKLITGKVRFSYVNVFEPKATPSGKLRYAATMLIPKSDNATYQRIKAEIDKTVQENLDKFNGVKPTNLKTTLYDGDGLRPGGEPFGEECKNCWVLSANSDNMPQVVDNNYPDPLPIMDKKEFYSGCYGRASLYFGAYNMNGSKGVYCKINSIQKLEDGERLDGRTSAKEDFAEPYQQSVAQQPMQQPTYQTPQPQYQQPVQQMTSQVAVDPITGQPIQQPTVNNIYGVN